MQQACLIWLRNNYLGRYSVPDDACCTWTLWLDAEYDVLLGCLNECTAPVPTSAHDTHQNKSTRQDTLPPGNSLILLWKSEEEKLSTGVDS